MEWPQILGAVGFGAIVTKLLDVVWLQRVAEQNERRRWLREKRYGVFSALAKELLTEGLWNSKTDVAECLRLNAELVVLSPAKSLGKGVNEYFNDVVETKRRIDHFINNGTSTIEERTELHQHEHERLRRRAADIMEELRVALFSE
jgi:hypothetical protein